MNHDDFDKAIRRVPDFPKPGINFYDITSILSDPEAFAYALSEMDRWIDELSVDTLMAVEARGFLFAAPWRKSAGFPSFWPARRVSFLGQPGAGNTVSSTAAIRSASIRPM
jgi:adenine/guanine phosphoribosyltransferase-like PRPP-binding protein